jgi:hypothetical protein
LALAHELVNTASIGRFFSSIIPLQIQIIGLFWARIKQLFIDAELDTTGIESLESAP